MDIAFANPMDFGMGIDALTLRPRNTNAVSAETLKEVRGSGSTQTVQFSLVNAETMEDFESTFSFGSDASVTYGLFHGSGAFQFAESHKYHSYSHYLIVSIRVTNTFKQIDRPKLNPATAGLELLTNGHQERFKEEFGDSYVLGIQQGGVFFAVLEFRSETQEDFESMDGALNVGVFGLFNTEAKFSSAVKQFAGKKNLKVHSFQQGGTNKDVKIDIDGIIDRALNFPGEVAKAAESYCVVLQDYLALDLPAPPNAVQLDNARLVLKRFYRIRNELLQKLNDIEYIRSNPEQFVKPEDFEFQEAERALTDALDSITASASQCANNMSECRFVPVVLPNLVLPERAGKKQREEALAIRGAVLAQADPLAALLRDSQPEGPNRRGFDIGMGVAEGHTLPGPGKDKFGTELAPGEQPGYRIAVQFSVDRNRNLSLASSGAQVVKADPAVSSARARLPLGLSWLGFDIACGLFGPKPPAEGHTLPGPGSDGIRDGLAQEARQGFVSGQTFHLGGHK